MEESEFREKRLNLSSWVILYLVVFCSISYYFPIYGTVSDDLYKYVDNQLIMYI